MKLRIALGMVVVGMASACGGGGEDSGGAGGAGEVVAVQLDEKNNSGKSGRGELQPGAASTDVTIEIIGGQSENDVIHVHTGSCDTPGEEIVHDLGFTTASLGQGQIFTTLDQVATGEYVIDIHDDETDEVVMCGRIPAQ